MVTAAKGAVHFYIYSEEGEENIKNEENSEGELQGLKVRRESPQAVLLHKFRQYNLIKKSKNATSNIPTDISSLTNSLSEVSKIKKQSS